ncbi:patatin-like phospholipase family protein [Rubrivivax albus]|uniref:patatin-like phospholipase family protein n=1 Tax=Rubrivivax albus TaxID=2499835 RepID=UPI0021754F13|nr:patatin-like phospholipase family protein [Rubrivivax albus]
MASQQPTPANVDLGAVRTLVFAGGGNRCWWQAGLVTTWLEAGWHLPPVLVGTSAGAAMAFALMTSAIQDALESCRRLYAANRKIVHRATVLPLRLEFAHARIYPAWIESFVTDDRVARVRDSPSRLHVGLSRPARWLGLGGSLAIASAAYLLERRAATRVHPALPKYLGLGQQLVAVADVGDGSGVRSLLRASAAAAPFMKAERIGGCWGFDGGYTDNAPLPEQSEAEREGTLVLLTRHYPELPRSFRLKQRTYLQPSRKIPVSTWDCRPRTTVNDAFALGLMDATSLAR